MSQEKASAEEFGREFGSEKENLGENLGVRNRFWE